VRYPYMCSRLCRHNSRDDATRIALYSCSCFRLWPLFSRDDAMGIALHSSFETCALGLRCHKSQGYHDANFKTSTSTGTNTDIFKTVRSHDRIPSQIGTPSMTDQIGTQSMTEVVAGTLRVVIVLTNQLENFVSGRGPRYRRVWRFPFEGFNRNNHDHRRCESFLHRELRTQQSTDIYRITPHAHRSTL
jgi:hypothetical protein